MVRVWWADGNCAGRSLLPAPQAYQASSIVCSTISLPHTLCVLWKVTTYEEWTSQLELCRTVNHFYCLQIIEFKYIWLCFFFLRWDYHPTFSKKESLRGQES